VNADTERSLNVVVVVPCYNEERRLDGAAFADYSRSNPNIRFLFVDDGSTDDTVGLLDDLTRRERSLDLFRLPTNLGKGEAVRLGIRTALEQDPDVVGYWDADLAAPLSELDAMVPMLTDDHSTLVVTGARVNLLGRSVKRNLLRHWIGRVFATCATGVLRLPMYDTQCGAKLFRTDAEITSAFVEPFTARWVFDVEILARLMANHRLGRTPHPATYIREHPLFSWYDTAGSKLRVRDAFGALGDLIRILVKYRPSNRGPIR
jgi:glycosyltransferase involved in cell wall biosynthesis